MMADSVNMSLDEIIKQSKQIHTGRSRSRGGGRGRGRGGGGGIAAAPQTRGPRGRSQTRGVRGRSQSRSRSNSRGPQNRSNSRGPQNRSNSRGPQNRSNSRGPQNRSNSRGPQNRSNSRGRQNRSQSRGRQNRSQSRGPQNRSNSQQRRRSASISRSRSRSRSQLRSLTPKGRAGLEYQQMEIPMLRRNNRMQRGGLRNQLRRSNSNPSMQNSIQSRLGMTTRSNANNWKPLAIAKRGISKRGRGINPGNRFSSVGLRSDQILKEKRQNQLIRNNNIIKSQTFRRSRNDSFNAASQLTVSVANDFSRRRGNNNSNRGGYLNVQNLNQFNNQYGGQQLRSGPGSVKSVGSNRSNRSNRSRGSIKSPRGRGASRGVSHKFINKQILNPKLQKEIAAIQGKTYGGSNVSSESPAGINCSPTPTSTMQTLHLRFATN